MRRLSQHRLTGSVRRLLGATMVAAVATTVVVVTCAARPASAAFGLDLNLGALGSINLNLPPSLPVTVPSGGAPSTSQAGLPGTTIPTVCPTNCAPSTTGGGTGPSQRSAGGNTGPASSGPAPRVGRGGSVPGGAAGGGSSGTAGSAVPRAAAGLAVSPPPPVEPLTPLAGISFGQAPYLWPLLVVLDTVALVAVVMLVRRTWSPNSDAD